MLHGQPFGKVFVGRPAMNWANKWGLRCDVRMLTRQPSLGREHFSRIQHWSDCKDVVDGQSVYLIGQRMSGTEGEL